MPQITVVPGDGVGPEVVAEAVKVLTTAGKVGGIPVEFRDALLGGAAIDATGSPMPAETLKVCRGSDAVLFGAVGGPRWDSLPAALRPEQGILALRKGLVLFANLRPARIFPLLVENSPLKRTVVEGVDLIVVRELTGGIYYGEPRRIEKTPEGERAIDTLTYTRAEITRIARVAFETALRRRRLVTSVDKANVLASSQLWRAVVTEVARDFPEVTLTHMYIDNCAMQLIRDPRHFDVILTENMFGDILSDEAAMLVGSIGLLPSASLGEERRDGSARRRIGIYEPIHGSAPDLAGQDTANPIAAILSAALLLRYSLDRTEEAEAIETAVERVLAAGYRTPDILQEGCTPVGTREMGDRISRALLSPPA